jgi:hypothetical protein
MLALILWLKPLLATLQQLLMLLLAFEGQVAVACAPIVWFVARWLWRRGLAEAQQLAIMIIALYVMIGLALAMK